MTSSTSVPRGALVIETKRETYLRQGTFDPQAVIAFLRETERLALVAGFTGLRVTGEMTWALGSGTDGETDPATVIEYEALLNDFFAESRSLAICQYKRALFTPDVVEDVLRTHPRAILGDQVCPNLYYEPPAMGLGRPSKAEKVDWMIGQLRRARGSEEAARASEAKFRRVAESGIVGLFFWELSGRVTEANDTFLTMLGYAREDVTAGRVDRRMLTPPEGRAADVALVAELVTHGRHGPVEKEYLGEDGRRVPVLVANALFDGSSEQGVCVCVDISRQAEARHAAAEAHAAAAHTEAVKASRAKSEFLAVMSHELRTPLNAIVGYQELLEQEIGGPINAQQRRQLGRINASASHLLALIDEVLALARIEEGQDVMRSEPVAVAMVLDQAAVMAEPLAAGKNLHFRVVRPTETGVPGRPYILMTDPGKL